MRKLFNFRPLIVVSLCFSLGILVSYLSLFLHILYVILLGFIPAVICLIYLFFNKNNVKVAIGFTILCEVVLLLGVLVFGIKLSVNRVDNFTDEGLINGRMQSVEEYYGNYRFVFDDCSFFAGGETFKNRKVYVISSNLPDLEVGDVVTFYGKISGSDCIRKDGSVDNYVISTNIWFTVRTDFNILQVRGYEPTVFEAVKGTFTDSVESAMGKESASLFLAMMFGSKADINTEIIKGMKYAGIVHIFAISGFNISFIAGIVHFVLKKMKLNGALNYVPSLLITFFYCGLCGFSPSSMRALIMFAIYLLFKTYGLKYDMLNSIVVSSVVLLAVNPFQMFSYGFILSYSAVLCMYLLTSPIRRFLSFMPEFFSNELASVMAAQIGMLSLTVYFFGYAPLMGIFVNFAMVPLVSLLFGINLVTMLLSAITTLSGIFLFVPEVLLMGFLDFFSYIDFGSTIVTLSSPLWLTVIYSVGVVGMSDVINLKTKEKIAISTICAIIWLVFSQLFEYGII